jgi:hypothetical protein
VVVTPSFREYDARLPCLGTSGSPVAKLLLEHEYARWRTSSMTRWSLTRFGCDAVSLRAETDPCHELSRISRSEKATPYVEMLDRDLVLLRANSIC